MRGALHTQLEGSSRYELLVKIASGGMATVYVGYPRSAPSSTSLVAIKRSHPHLLEDPTFCRSLISEARLASRVVHPNVVRMYSIDDANGELLLVMDYIEGASLSELLVAASSVRRPFPPRIALRILLDACAGLQAAYDATDEQGHPLCLVHRDVSPQNILIGVDGVSRLTDFGVAKSVDSTNMTATGALKGKLAYMPPEYMEGRPFDHRGDLFSMGVVAWETLAHQRLFRGANEIETMRKVIETVVPPLSSVAPHLGTSFDAVIGQALARTPSARYASARQFAAALEIAAYREGGVATNAEVGAFVWSLVGHSLSARRALVQERLAAATSSSHATLPTDAPPASPALDPSLAAADEPGTIALPAGRQAASSPAHAGAFSGPQPWTPSVPASFAPPPSETSTLGGSGVSSIHLLHTPTGPSRAVPPARRKQLTLIFVALPALLLLATVVGVGLHLGGSSDSAELAAELPSASLSVEAPPPPPPSSSESAALASASAEAPVASASAEPEAPKPAPKPTATSIRRPTRNAAPKPTIAPNPYRTHR